MAQDINEELNRQEPLMDEIDTKIDIVLAMSDSEEEETKKKSKKSVDFDELPVATASMNMSKKEAEKEQPVSERSVPASDSALEDSDEELYVLEMEEAAKKRRVLDRSDIEEEKTKVTKKKRSKKSVDKQKEC